jgi:hypothetical protein
MLSEDVLKIEAPEVQESKLMDWARAKGCPGDKKAPIGYCRFHGTVFPVLIFFGISSDSFSIFSVRQANGGTGFFNFRSGNFEFPLD